MKLLALIAALIIFTHANAEEKNSEETSDLVFKYLIVNVDLPIKLIGVEGNASILSDSSREYVAAESGQFFEDDFIITIGEEGKVILSDSTGSEKILNQGTYKVTSNDL